MANLFPILNAEQLSCTYSVWRVQGLNPEDDEFERNRITLRTRISRDVAGPAETYLENDTLFIAIPEGCGDPEPSYSLTPYVVKLEKITSRKTVEFSSKDFKSRLFAVRFLQSAITVRLWNDRLFWQPRAGRPYFFKNPANAYDEKRDVDVFEGYSIRVVFVEGTGYCVLIDYRTHYVSSHPWPEIIPFGDRWNYLKHTPTEEEETQTTTHCVYHFGSQWYEILVQGIRRESISDTLFLHPETNQPVSVYEFTLDKWQNLLPEWCTSIRKDWTAITYVTWKDGPKRHGAAHLCYPVLGTVDLERKGRGGLHQKYAIKEPESRLDSITGFVRRFVEKTSFGETTLSVSDTPLMIPSRTFLIPSLEFGEGKVLNPNTNPLRNYPRSRLQTLQDPNSGFWRSEPLQQQWVLLPRRIKDSVGPAFLRDIAAEIERFGTSKNPYHYEPKPIWYDDFPDGLYYQVKTLNDAIEKKAQELSEQPTGYCLVILPGNARSDVAAYLTSNYSQRKAPLHMACIHLSSFEENYRFNSRSGEWVLDRDHPNWGRTKGYLRNVAIKLLILNRQWPFVFQHHQRYSHLIETLYIGFDVLNSTAGFTFVGNGGRICFFDSRDSAEDQESISQAKVQSTIGDNVADLRSAYDWFPQNVVLIRDGRLFARELRGFKAAMADLGISTYSAVEIPKTSALGIRFFQETVKGSRKRIVRNPHLGTQFKVDQDEIVVCTTGWPFSIPGTAKPLTIRRRWGTEPIERLGEGVFALAQLAWTAPDRPARYPLVIRYADMRLQALAADFDDEEIEIEPIAEADDFSTEEIV